MRNKVNYKKGLLENNFRKTGIMKPSVFKDLTDFHMTENLSVDYMHDLLEGLCQYDLGKILNYFIKQKKFFFRFSPLIL